MIKRAASALRLRGAVLDLGSTKAAPRRPRKPRRPPRRPRKPRRRRYRWYWDVEASDPKRRWDGATLIIAQREDGERVTFRGRACLAQFAAFIDKNRDVFYAHYGGGYDVPLLLNYWRPEKIVTTGSTILVAEGRGGLSMRDTFPFWLASLAKIGDAIGFPKLDIDRSQIERLTQQELEDYCLRDVQVLHEANERHCRPWLESYDVNPDNVSTAGTAATRLMQVIEPESFQLLQEHKIETQLICEMLNGGANPGGMTAAYALGRRYPVYSYDVKSSYPARYANREVPIGLRKAESNELADPESFQGIAYCSYYWPYRRRVPVAYDDGTGAGFGHIESWLVDDEIRILLELGIKPILHRGWCGVDYAPIGQTFARELFAAKEKPGPQSFFPKTWVNSWHGKTGMNPVRDNYEARYPRKWWNPDKDPTKEPRLTSPQSWLWHFYTLGCDKNGLAPWHSQPMISAIVLGRARAALWRINDAFQQAGWAAYYNDTDSLLTDCPPERAPVALGKDLGMLNYEGGPYEAIFLGSKAYILIDQNGMVAKCALKGVPHKSYKDSIWAPEDIRGDGVMVEVLREARSHERLAGEGVFTRKGVGRDRRIELFERALAGSAHAYKEGLRTFKKGLRTLDWKRDSLTREVKPTVNTCSFDADGWRLLSADEIYSD